MFYWFESKAQVLDRFVKLQDELSESNWVIGQQKHKIDKLHKGQVLLNSEIENLKKQVQSHRRYEEKRKAEAQQETTREQSKADFESVFSSRGPFADMFNEQFKADFGFGPGTHFNFGGGSSQHQRGWREPVTNWNDIKAQYKKDAKQHHPDTVMANGGSEADIKAAQQKMQEINTKYEKDKERYK